MQRVIVDNSEAIEKELQKEFPPEDIEWRVGPVNEQRMQGIALAYVTNRAIQSRLDNVFGPFGWTNDYKEWHDGSQLCGISVKVIGHDGKAEWITKWDGAENTSYEAIKGGLSDSMKRTAVQFGIGRYLYKMPTIWVSVKKRGKSYFIEDDEVKKLNNMLKSNKWKEWIKKHGAFDFDASGNVHEGLENSLENKKKEKKNNYKSKKKDNRPITDRQKEVILESMDKHNLKVDKVENLSLDEASKVIKLMYSDKPIVKNKKTDNGKETSKDDESKSKNDNDGKSTAQKAIKNGDKKSKDNKPKKQGTIASSQKKLLMTQIDRKVKSSDKTKETIVNQLCSEFKISSLDKLDKSQFGKAINMLSEIA